MQRELLQMRKELAEIFAGNTALKQAAREVSRLDITRASLIARNPKHRSVQVDRILNGELQKDVPVGDYMFIQNSQEMINAAYNNLQMGNSMNAGLLLSCYRILAEDPDAGFRRENPVVYAFNHVPPDASDVDTRLTNAFRKIYGGYIENDIVARAMYMHNSIIDVWPFEEFNGELAVFAMNYYLMENGFMPIDMDMEKADYDELVGACLKGLRPDEEYEFFRNQIIDKMAGTIEACRSCI